MTGITGTGSADPDDGPALQVEGGPDGTILVTGQIDISNSMSALQQMLGLVRPGHDVALDVSGLSLLGSHALTAIVDLHNIVVDGGASLVVVTGTTNRIVRRVLELSGIGATIRIVAELDGLAIPADGPPPVRRCGGDS
ncbi:MAG: STAS domain-containing protein [Pseudonocardia sp.]|uniref:STAS domain-containing protein n=1 Tax=unclassified Pseudonocardia TaxID=2619320 RepID=UPI00086B34A4|nr:MULTISPECIES: STAS domain-containing protein [unclassified Pseudonocardia]MBN9112355.1 STAS domain-containing protein [Pseudonocardia sp.]ODU28254.1 MAG: hypothetical protein ABS80_02740 [Pseudonocardia sp. SCN 72-51]ODV08983.1 MAG: hypothetical protein ABT15_01720 [Pseudonocardia sp. SCN 73-27]